MLETGADSASDPSRGSPPPTKQLERSLGALAVVAISVSSMLGTAVFVLPGLAAALTGPTAWLAYLLAALCVLPAAMCKAELATAMPTSGGAYIYLDRIFGPLVGTVTGLLLWLSMLLKSSFALLGFGMYLSVLSDLPLIPTALVLLLAIMALNVAGLRNVSRTQIAIMLITAALLAVLVVLSFKDFRAAHFTPALPHGAEGLFAATALVFVSYNGITKIAAIAEEVKNPGRNVPLAIFLSLGLVAVTYALVCIALVSTLPTDGLVDDLRPIHTLASAFGGEWFGYVAAVIGIITMTSMANSGLLAASRFPFAMSRDHLLPQGLAHLSSRYGTPVLAIALTGAGMAVAILFLDVARLAKLASAMVIALFIAVNAAVVVFRESRVRWYAPKYRAPFYPWLQGAGILVGIALLATLGTDVALAAALTLIPGVGLFLLYGRRRVTRRGVVGVRGRRAELLQAPAKHQAIEETITSRAAVVVALFGKERSPETLVEAGLGLAGSGSVEALHVTEVPEQLTLGDALEEEVKVRSLRRRFLTMAERKGRDLRFHAVVSRDIVHTVHSVTRYVECRWLVMAWQGRTRASILPYNPLGWLINHLDCNLAFFRDAGVRYIREIMVYAEPGPHDALVVSTADELAQLWEANLTLVRHVGPNATVQHQRSEHEYLEQLAQQCEAPTSVRFLTGRDVVSSVATETASFDLLVMGWPDMRLLAELMGSPYQSIIARAECSVLALKTPRVKTHEAYRKKTHSSTHSQPLLERLHPGGAAARLEVTRKDAAFGYFANAFGELIDGVSAKEITEALWERERTQNTSLGHGVALPHATLPALKSTLVGVFTTKAPIDYQAPDGAPVDVFFVTLSPPAERNLHLTLLSNIAALSLGTPLLERLRAAATAEEILTATRECAERAQLSQSETAAS